MLTHLRISILPAALIGLALALATCPAHAAVLSVAPAETTVIVGDTFKLRVTLDAVPDLKGSDLIYGFTSARLQFLGALAGDVIAGPLSSYFDHVLPDVTAPQDSIWYDGARLSGTGSGPGVVVFLTFKATSLGNAHLDCLATDLRDSSNQMLAHSCEGGLVHIVGPTPVRPASWGRVRSIYR